MVKKSILVIVIKKIRVKGRAKPMPKGRTNYSKRIRKNILTCEFKTKKGCRYIDNRQFEAFREL